MDNYDLELNVPNIDVNLGQNIIEIDLPGGTRGLKGDTGETGPQGETGPANTLTIGTVEDGETADAEIIGDSPNQVLNLVLPKGDKGDTGETGSQGPPGETGPAGVPGQDGEDGQDGYSPTITSSKVGKVTTLTITDINGTTTATILDGADGQGSGDMMKSVYDTDDDGIVDNAEKVNNHTVLSDVPANAVFTDTTYTNVSEFTNDVGYVKNTDLSTIATSGSYSDLTDKPIFNADFVFDNVQRTITNEQYQSLIEAGANGDELIILIYGYVASMEPMTGYITLSTIRYGYIDVFKISTTNNNHTVSQETITLVKPSDLATVATTGAYSDLSGTPTIPTVNNATLTIQKNGTDVQTFTANASSDVTANITVPTATSDLTNDSGYTTNTGTITSVKMNGSTVASSGEADLGTVLTSHQSIKTINSNTITGTGNVSVGTITKVQANGTDVSSSGTANIPAASTSVYGVTKLSSSTSSTSTALAATASAVKSAYDLATVTISKNNSTTPTKVSFKFPSGLLINTAKITLSSINCNTAWGGIYASGTQSGVSYQTAFTTLLSCNVTLDPTSNNAWCMEVVPGSTFNELTTTPPIQVLRGTSGSVSGVVNVIAIGLWK